MTVAKLWRDEEQGIWRFRRDPKNPNRFVVAEVPDPYKTIDGQWLVIDVSGAQDTSHYVASYEEACALADKKNREFK